MPDRLVATIKGELTSLQCEGRTRTFMVEYRVEKGIPIEARVRNRETLHIVALSS